MPTIHIPEAEAARNFAAVMSHVRSGVDVAIEENGETVALVTRATKPPGRLLSEAIALAEARGSTATLDGGFERDLMDFIDSHREPLEPPAWD
jgi:antitoxin (DNA-binding transcriptional repressor) of toxin-antitoxin stability system